MSLQFGFGIIWQNAPGSLRKRKCLAPLRKLNYYCMFPIFTWMYIFLIVAVAFVVGEEIRKEINIYKTCSHCN